MVNKNQKSTENIKMATNILRSNRRVYSREECYDVKIRKKTQRIKKFISPYVYISSPMC